MLRVAYAALWIFIFSLPWEGVIVLPGISIIPRVTGGVALSLALLAIGISGRFRRWHAFHVAALLFVFWAGCVLLAFDLPEIPAKFWTFVQLLVVVWLIWELAPSRERQLGLLAAYVFGAYFAAFETLMVYRREAGLSRRFAAGGADPNDLAMTLALALPMAWFLAMTYRKPLQQWVFRGYLLIGLVALGLTGSRGGMIASAVGLLIIPLTVTRLSPVRRATAMVLLSASLVVAAVNTPDTLIQRLASTGTEVEEADLGGRFRIWVAGVNAFAQNPLLGYGTSNFKKAVRPWGVGQVAHNSFLSVLVEQGLVGFVLYMAMFVTVFLSVLKLPTLERRFALVLLATVGIAMLPLTWEDRKAVWFVLAALLGLSQAWITRPGEGARQPPPFQPAAVTARPRAARPRAWARAPGRIDAGNAKT